MDNELALLASLDEQIAEKLDQKRRNARYGKHLEGYADAMLAVRSMIHDRKEAIHNGRKWW